MGAVDRRATGSFAIAIPSTVASTDSWRDGLLPVRGAIGFRAPTILLAARPIVSYVGTRRIMPRFHVRDTFAISDRAFFVLAGFAIEGEIQPGMLVRLPFTARVTVTEEIDHIQRVERPDGEVMCLCIRCHTPDEATLWEALKLTDTTVEIIKAT